MNNYQRFIALSRYARHIPEQNRRESWEETVDRLCTFWKNKYPDIFPYEEMKQAITNLEVMPSMRSLMTAGPALDRDNIAGYNCSFIAVDDPKAFDEAMYILMCGTGLGFSVEAKHIQKLPEINQVFYDTNTVIEVQDSRIGWASAYRQLIALLYQGAIPKWDTSKVRPAGAPLKTFGGRASGPEPLEDLFRFTVDVFLKAAGRKLTSLECHDIVCKVADIVVVGGVRRSALISLSDLDDGRLRHAKDGEFWVHNRQRALANNSAVYDGTPDIGTFMREWLALYESKSGERGIFNKKAVIEKVKENGRRDADHDFGTNPCGEIILRPQGLCNLSEVVIRPHDTKETLKRKVELATILGTFQSTLTKFRYVRKVWQKNAEEERLLGVSLTGIYDHPELCLKPGAVPIFKELKEHAINTNRKWAAKIGINASTAITTIN
ncbi:hypothetical protein [Microcystis sp. M42BS1]|uniref:hypothetical protein n=1 Tax=Microcystis sp. M42BS1 TaxID=2771192 RepID=UPI00258658A1|nr:hypothetical protein [Microcystis sp. M42BS1]MCA2570651.1 hypothetical protein [Microcystis sp. M42BS1]